MECVSHGLLAEGPEPSSYGDMGLPNPLSGHNNMDLKEGVLGVELSGAEGLNLVGNRVEVIDGRGGKLARMATDGATDVDGGNMAGTVEHNTPVVSIVYKKGNIFEASKMWKGGESQSERDSHSRREDSDASGQGAWKSSSVQYPALSSA
ncbi:hypothetical protein Q3G72_020867 [Acer saccharum]|nr:hypothetical protein Q3G72_020867 [Acer saccharum]